jgi:glutathione S-transferase
MLKLYVDSISANARRAHMTAILLGLPIEVIPVALGKGEHKSPDYLKLNPNGKVPTLVDGDLKLFESIAIAIYMTEQVPDQRLYPAAAKERALANQWLFWTAAHWSPVLGQISFERIWKQRLGLGETNAYAVERNETIFKDAAKVLDQHLAQHKFMLGNDVTLPDLALATPLMYSEMAKYPTKEFGNIARWYAQIRELDAWKKTEPQF